MFTEVTHYSAAVALAVLLGYRRDFPREYWVVSVAYMVSWFIDAAVDANQGGFAAAHVLMGLQAAMFAVVMITRTRPLMAATFVIAVAATVAPLIMHDHPPRMVFVSLVAIPALGWRLRTWDHELRWAVGVYIVVAALLSAWMVSYYPNEPEPFGNVFAVYTLARWASFGLFIHAAYKWRASDMGAST